MHHRALDFVDDVVNEKDKILLLHDCQNTPHLIIKVQSLRVGFVVVVVVVIRVMIYTSIRD